MHTAAPSFAHSPGGSETVHSTQEGIRQQKYQRHHQPGAQLHRFPTNGHLAQPPSPSLPHKQPRNRRALRVVLALMSMTLLYTLFSQAALPARLASSLQGLTKSQGFSHSDATAASVAAFQETVRKQASMDAISAARDPGTKSEGGKGGSTAKASGMQSWISRKTGVAGQEAAQLPHPIWWAAPFHSVSGYGQEALSYTKSLLDLRLIRPEDLWLTHSGDGASAALMQSFDADTKDFLSYQDWERMGQALPETSSNRSAVLVCHSFPNCWLHPKVKTYAASAQCPCPRPEMEGRLAYKIGRTMFETDKLPQALVAHCLEFDEVWVPSEFNRQTFTASGVPADKLFVLPEGIDTAVFDPARHKPLSLPALMPTQITGVPAPGRVQASRAAAAGAAAPKPFIFLSIFKWELRKGWPILLKAYLNEFRGNETVELHIVTHSFMETVHDWTDKIHRGIINHAGLPDPIDWTKLPKIFLHTRYIKDSDYPSIYRAVDCLVVPTRGEGWGRPQMEAMSMGLPVISTNWSGLTAFMNTEVAYPIDVEAMDEAPPGSFSYFVGTKWARPSLSHLQQLMRHVVSHPGEARAKGAAARLHIVSDFSSESVARKLLVLVQRVQEKLRLRDRDRDSGGRV
ncbi:MAG: hypothetical protein WDW36_001431 [Sanguina aurantia]